jgi:cyclic pyranopterin phosphate synthase
MEQQQQQQPPLTHIDRERGPRMVDVGAKAVTQREAVARGRVAMRPETLEAIRTHATPKGDVLSTAQLAGVMAAKRTSELIPLCHPIPLSFIGIDLQPGADGASVEIEAAVRTTGQTGAEMEALTAVSVAALTVYDMCKAMDKAMRVEAVRLVRKTGGKSGDVILED